MSSISTLAPIDKDRARVFSKIRLIRFSDCDPAGMVFYPQYFIMLNELLEDWFTEGLGVNYAHLLGVRKIGLPTVTLQSEFHVPSRLGETLEMCLQVVRVGVRSISLHVDYVKSNVRCVQIALTIVTTSLDHDGAIDIPSDVRESISHWQSINGEIG